MQPTTKSQIKTIKEHGFELYFSTVFTHALENYKKIAAYAGLIIIVFSIIAGFIGIGILFAFYGAVALSENFLPQLLQTRLTGIHLLFSLIAQLFLGAVISPLMAGFYKMADSAEKDETFKVSSMFYYYKAPYFSKIVSTTIIISAISILISSLTEQIGLTVLGLGITLIISFISYLAIPLVIFGELEPIEAIKGSYTIMTKEPIVLAGLIITAFLASMLGFIGCCIGVFFTIPLNYSMTYAIYHAILSRENLDPIDSIGTIE
ncbi:hypothetical protein [Flavobacterium agrisoli]|uniref:Uncharacterized protein n=1 Tax=Flavobacterium agrisoli TaxID=2793066 RepID=A0A934PP99_9FLAO|nr:hypothetical protein [Flavobacterium agrisoli]MBK0370131.1 hypothetical protein [Flavobacterium agrisoli]